jgi:toxin ParE1/3/4
MDYRIIWSPEAIAQLGRVVRYMARDNPAAAEKVGHAIIEKCVLLADFPRLGKIFRKMARDDIREIPVPPYRIIYSINDGGKVIEILTVWHGARQEPDVL